MREYHRSHKKERRDGKYAVKSVHDTAVTRENLSVIFDVEMTFYQRCGKVAYLRDHRNQYAYNEQSDI